MIASTQTNHPLSGVKEARDASKPIDVATSRLKAAGLRITQPRISILEALIRIGRPASIEHIHAELAHAACDLVTVYRCLAAFEELGLVRRSFFHNGTGLYEINVDGLNRYHVICKSTNQVEEIDAETTAELRQALHHIEEILKSRGYGDVSHVVEFFGVAPQASRIAATTAIPASR